MTREAPAIVLIGATGFTGGLIARELADAESPFVLAGRDPERLRRLAGEIDGAVPHVVDVTDPDSLRRLIRPGDVVINTAGPFAVLGEPVIAACVERGAHYLDTTGEQAFMRDIHGRYDAAAAAAGIAVVNAMAFEYALGDCAVAVAARGLTTPLRGVDVVYAWGGAASSRGTRRTAVRIIGTRGWTREDGTFRRQTPGSAHRIVRLASGKELHAIAFPAGEVVASPRHIEAAAVRGWLVMGRATARIIPILAPALPLVVGALRPLLEALAGRGTDPTPEERRASRFTIRVELEADDGRRRALEVRGRDPYGITATAICRGARTIMERDAPAGVLAPAQLMDPGRFLASLSGDGLETVQDPVWD